MNNAGILTFIALASVMFWFIISGKGSWLPKFLGIIAVVAFGAILWFSSVSFTGWPSRVDLPEKALFVAGYALEPNEDSDGAIYVWLVSPPIDQSIYEYQAQDGEPRAYVLPYTREMHEQVQGATEATKAGQRVAFMKRPGEGEQRVGQQQRNSGNRGGDQGTQGGQPGFYILPSSDGPVKR